jgi:hypothetical protein
MKKRTYTKKQVDMTRHNGFINGETAIYAMAMKEHHEYCIQKQIDAGVENPGRTKDFYDFSQFSEETKNKILTYFFVKTMLEDIDYNTIIERTLENLKEKSKDSVTNA